MTEPADFLLHAGHCSRAEHHARRQARKDEAVHHRTAPIAGGRPAARSARIASSIPISAVGNLMGAAREQISPQLHAARAQRLHRVREGRQRNPRISVPAGEVNRRPGRRGRGSSIRRNADPATRQRRHRVRRRQTCAKILNGEAGACEKPARSIGCRDAASRAAAITAARWSSASESCARATGVSGSTARASHHAPRGARGRTKVTDGAESRATTCDCISSGD